MACCYIAASMIAFIIKTCDVLNVDLNLQYNESLDPSKEHEGVSEADEETQIDQNGISTISISGMTCASCVTAIETALLAVKGVESALVSLHFHEARVFHSQDLAQKRLVSAIEEVGFEASLGERATPQKIDTLRQQTELQALSSSLSRLSVLSTVILILGDGVDYLGLAKFPPLIQADGIRQLSLLMLTAVSAFVYCKWIFRSAFEQARRLRLNMHILIAVSTLLGIALSLFNVLSAEAGTPATYYNTVVGVLFIVTAGRYVDLLSRR